MKTIVKTFAYLMFALLIFSCQGEPEILFHNLSQLPNGRWLLILGNSTKIIYDFKESNEIEIFQYRRISSSEFDTSYFYGTYEIFSSNILIHSIKHKIPDNPNNSLIFPGDTIIYFHEKQDLILSFSGRSYEQLSGSPGILENGKFYKVIKYSNNTFHHILYTFQNDTMSYYSSLTQSGSIPDSWELESNYRYESTDKYIFPDYNPGTEWISYKFTKDHLFIAHGTRNFTKY